MSTSRLPPYVCASLCFNLLAGCAPAEPSGTEPDAADEEASAIGTEYVEIGDYLTSDADIERWLALRRTLASAFDDICGDTFARATRPT